MIREKDFTKDNMCLYHILDLEDGLVFGLTATQINYEPTFIKLVESTHAHEIRMLPKLWQSLIAHNGSGIRTINSSLVKTSNIIIQRFSSPHHEALIIKTLDGQAFRQAQVVLSNCIALMTLNPLMFLAAEPLSQLTQLQQLARYLNHCYLDKHHYAVKFNEEVLQLAKQGFSKSNRIEKIAFSLMVALINQPHLHVIRISNWALLNPRYLSRIKKLALQSGRVIWITTDTMTEAKEGLNAMI